LHREFALSIYSGKEPQQRTSHYARTSYLSYSYRVVAVLLPDLLRHEALTTLRPVPTTVIAEFVDDIFLPLVRDKRAREKDK
jgi:hypothetical protein